MADSHSIVAEPHSAELALRHQFDTPEQQKDASTLGMWIFLVTEIMFFGGMFTAYTGYRTYYASAFAAGSNTLDITLGALNTAILICSSFTMALSVHSSQLGRRRALVGYLVITMMFGLAFLGIKAIEWHEKFVERHVPGPWFHFEGPDPAHTELFFSLYFAMTGLHAAHMVVGVGILLVFIVRAWRGVFTPKYHTPVEIAGLYWHFVDIIWIFLFPLLYLIGRHQH